MADPASASRPQLRKQDLLGKVALVTGASKGIGRAVAFHLASRGCSILGTSSNPSTISLIESLASEVATFHNVHKSSVSPKVVAICASIASPDHPQLITNAVEEHFSSQIDIYVNNAAAVERTPVGSLEPEQIANSMFCNIQNPAMTIDLLVQRRYFQRESRIVFISSAESTRCDPSALMYATTKAANEAMARCYANAFGGNLPEFEFMSGTTANSVQVGLTETAWTKVVPEEVLDKFKAYWLPRQSLPRMAQPEDVADIVGLLCSHDARWITGSKVCGDGGAVKII